MSKNIIDYLMILELTPGASMENVKQSYRDLCMIWHPDRAPNRLKQKSTEKLQLINEAYNWIINNPASLNCKVKDKEIRDRIIVKCSKCSEKLKVPDGAGVLQFVCPKCKSEFLYDSDNHEFTTKEKEAQKKNLIRKNKIKSLLVEFSSKIKQKDHLYIYPDLPWKRIERAIDTYANLDNDEEPMAYLKLSGLNKGSILLTDKRLYWQSLREAENYKPYRIEIQKIQIIGFKEQGEKGQITINADSVIDVGFFPSGEEPILVEILQNLIQIE